MKIPTGTSEIKEQVALTARSDKLNVLEWDPPFSGDLDICIKADGTWWHEGAVFQRKELVTLFASILRREADGEYYLTTPHEKWKIQVDLHPLIVLHIENVGDTEPSMLDIVLNTGERVPIGPDFKIFLDERAGNVAAVNLWNGLSAIFSRPAWYELASYCDESFSVCSRGERFNLII